MRKFSFRTISAKYFAATVLLIVFPICIFFQISSKYNLNTALNQKRISDLSTLHTFSENIDTWMTSVTAVSSLAASDASVQEFLKEATLAADTLGKSSYRDLDNRFCLSRYADSLDSILAFTLADPDLYIIGEQQLNLDRLNYFFHSSNLDQMKKDPDAACWTKTYSIEFLETGSVHKIFSLLYPSCDENGNVLGYVVAFVDTSYFSSILESYGDSIYVIEGDLIIGSKRELTRSNNLFSLMQISYSLLLEDESVIIEKEHDSIIVTTRYFQPLDIHLLLVSSWRELELQQSTTMPSLITIVLYIIILSILMAIVLTHVQTKHIRELKNVMNSIKGGDLSIRYQPQTKDEIAELGITFNSLLDRIQELMLQQKLHQKTRRKMELQMIQEQVKPHFLYNVLEMINSMIRCNMTTEAISAVEKLAGFYRISLNRGSDILSVSSEFQLIEKYLCLQKMRYIEFMDYVLAFSPEIHKYQIPKLTLQPLIENSIYHGIKEKDGKSIICVSGYLENGNVVLEVFDTGTGILPEKLEELREMIASGADDAENHFGLASVIRRLNIHYNDQAALRIDSVYGEYTCVTLLFPAKEYERSTSC